jgi:hypothetical protein
MEGRRRTAAEYGARFVPIGLALLLGGCIKVDVTPLGTTHDGRRQYELTCNGRATDNGVCHEKAIALCEGSYETTSIGSTGPGVGSYNGQLFTTPAGRVLLIACNG